MLDVLTARQFQPDAAGIQHADGKASVPTETLAVPEFPDRKAWNRDNLPAGAKGLTKNSPVESHAPQTHERRSTPADAQPAPAPANRPATSPSNLLSALHPHIEKTVEPSEASSLIPPASNQPKQSPLAGEAQLFQTGDKHLQRALSEMENLQLNFFSAATSQGGAPLPDGLETAKGCSSNGTSGRLSVDSADDLRQKQAATGLQNSGKDTGGSHTSTSQDASNTLLPNPAAGSSGDSSMDSKSGQNSSAKHSDILQSASSGASSIANAFGSITTSSTAAPANGIQVASCQVALANSTPANAGPLPQPGAPHAAVADNLAAVVENHLNPMGGMVNAASMLQAQGKTEMRVALQTESLGPLELHAVLDGGRVGASIAVVNHEAHTLLTNNLPALQQVLTDQNLRLDHFSVLNVPMSSGTNTGNGGGFHSGGHTQSRPNAPRWAFSPPIQVAPGATDSSVAEGLRGRLSVRA